ncbi:MAG: hypothetical protein JO030_03870 [Candidatus Eremiobacteraeota bacterium]|nr:hypothetical protein [Candidatus Eremiobacteraeota bacterium]
MTSSTVVRRSARVALSRLIDYAGLFPPAQLPMRDARAEYAQARNGPLQWMLGRFILRASSLPDWDDGATPLSLILDDPAIGAGALRRTGARVEVLELPAPTPPYNSTLSQLRRRLSQEGLSQLPAYVEVARAQSPGEVHALLRMLADAGIGAKLRCGGVTPDAFPSVDEVADFLIAANEASVAFKATAGLHHPVRRRDRTTGFMMHGFLNLLVAGALAGCVERETLREVLAEEEPAAFSFDESSLRWRHRAISISELESLRRNRFISYGSCSFAEPVQDLTALGILPCP